MPGLTIKQFFQIAASQYHTQLKMWNEMFPCRVFVATSDDMKADMADATNRIYTWLGMNESPTQNSWRCCLQYFFTVSVTCSGCFIRSPRAESRVLVSRRPPP